MPEIGNDARSWDEDAYRNSILKERELQSLTVFRTVFAPSQNPNPDIIVVASSDGSVSPYSISSSISSYPMRFGHVRNQKFLRAEAMCLLQGHEGPAYDVKFYGDGDDALLLRSHMSISMAGLNTRIESEFTPPALYK